MSEAKQNLLICVFLSVISLFIFTRGLNVHGLESRDDEIFYYKSTQEMYNNRDYLSPTYFGENRFQKPILFYWLILLSYKMFGISWFTARVVSSVFASLTICLTWLIAKDLFDKRIAYLSSAILLTVSLFFRHAKNVVPDMPLNFFIVFAIFAWLKFSGVNGKRARTENREGDFIHWELLFFTSCSLGFMVKGFAAVIVPLFTAFFCSLSLRNLKFGRKINFLKGFLVFVLIVLPWFIYMIKVHGPDYVKYMLINETKERLINQNQNATLIGMMFNFIDHLWFYTRTIFSYFAPWSIFLVFALPLSIRRVFSRNISDNEKDPLKFLLIWMLVVLAFFSFMYFAINHYILVLTTPFAILISNFFLRPISKDDLLGKIINFLCKYTFVAIFPIGAIAFVFLAVFMAGQSRYWLPVYCVVFFLAWLNMIKSRSRAACPWTLALLLIFVFSQSSLMNKAGMTSYSVLQKFAKTINNDKTKNFSIGVGSQDIHEKEFQIYFNEKVDKLGVSWHDGTKQNLIRFFKSHKNAYCLITEKDYQTFLKESGLEKYKIIQEDYILRKRMHLDKGFWLALLKARQVKVHDYLMEKLILLRKVGNG